MIKIVKIWARNFKMFNDVEIELDKFNVLAGKNMTGKSTLFELINFVGYFVKNGLPDAFHFISHNRNDSFPDAHRKNKMSENFDNTCFNGNKGNPLRPIQIALIISCHNVMYRYEIQIGKDDADSAPSIQFENLFDDRNVNVRIDNEIIDTTDIDPSTMNRWLIKRIGKQVSYCGYFGTLPAPAGSSLGALAEDSDKWADVDAIRRFLESRITSDLDKYSSKTIMFLCKMRYLKDKDIKLFEHSLHIISDGTSIKIEDILIPDDVTSAKIKTKDRTFSIYELSHSITRMMYILALPYINVGELIMIENPDSGLHPLTAQGLFYALKHARAQVLVASHSMPFLACAELSESIIFTRLDDGSSKIEPGIKYPSTRRLVDVYSYGQ